MTLPGTAGPVEAKVKGGAFRAHPVLVVGDGEHTTGPPTPRLLQALGVLPVLSLLVFHGLLGFALAFGGVAITMTVIRSARSDRATMAVIDTVLVVALLSATS
ncbi:hypothetical protein IFT73_03485 [Aeromicrobium sp. CFBP 8757]|uniref:hypothetical protein n=1 Tax=Aeromicrobium sp. CFBP 8757 TaxID=2775288 RepID=UPI00177DAB17|nr:hypothetical protein [Aeromicrobium sp. CFBP 8757]MBD8605904.1 hypothetical protein [Aeromicrobium sp. CFBP 8757]